MTAMPQFAVFFSDGAGFGIEMVQALDAAHAQDIARAPHLTGRLSAVPAELLNGFEEFRQRPNCVSVSDRCFPLRSNDVCGRPELL